jgi:hypothetical protein
LGNITGSALAGAFADDLEMHRQWRILNKLTLEKMKAGEWQAVEITVERDVLSFASDIDL